MARLVFVGGPAAGQQVENVEPTKLRWWVTRGETGWWSLEEPPEDDDVEITVYRVVSIKADPSAAEDDPNPTLHTYMVIERMPGTLPCECGHEWEQHDTLKQYDEFARCGEDDCDCVEYRPIPRSEARKREYEAGRAEAEATASLANRTERKSQDFPTEATPGHRFWVDQRRTFKDAEVHAGGFLPYAIVVGDYAVVDNRPGGQAVYMTYKTESGAESGLARARMELPDARIAEYEHGD